MTNNYAAQSVSHLETLPGLFISHGSPMLAIQEDAVVDALKRIALNLPRPRAIVVMSAHWEQNDIQISTATRPRTWHDFHGFPAALYQIHYPAAGDPALAEQLIARLHMHGFVAYADALRPRDHGVWMPLLHLYPQADIAVVQIALPRSFSPHQLYRIGQVLAYLRYQQILVIGSGSITHNLAELDWRNDHAQVPRWASEFRNEVAHALQVGDFDKVLNWQDLPYAQRNHPTAEHLQPLFFAMGTGTRMNVIHSSFAMGALGMDIYRFD